MGDSPPAQFDQNYPGGGDEKYFLPRRFEGVVAATPLGGPAHSFPPFFYSGAPLFFSGGTGASANTKKQTDAKQREAEFLTR
jgi:hypothetical protein